jgi:predicted transcriptional regulator
MNLTGVQKAVLLTLTSEWQSSSQIANQIPSSIGAPSDVNESLRDLMNLGLVQVNPIVLGTYRLTATGISVKKMTT